MCYNTLLLTNNNADFEWIPLLTNIGLFIIVFYGVGKILIELMFEIMFGYKPKIRRGLLDLLAEYLKPVRVLNNVESIGKKDAATVKTVAAQILPVAPLKEVKKVRKGMKNFINSVKQWFVRNPKTFFGILSLVLFAAHAISVQFFDFNAFTEVIEKLREIGVPVSNSVGDAIYVVLMAALGYLGISGEIAGGLETQEQYELRKQEKDKEIAAKEAAKKLAEREAKIEKAARNFIERCRNEFVNPETALTNSAMASVVKDKVRQLLKEENSEFDI